MSSPDGPSTIRVFVHWHGQTVFAGEEVKCTITFKNVAPPPATSSSSSSTPPSSFTSGSHLSRQQQLQQQRLNINNHRLPSPLLASQNRQPKTPTQSSGLAPPPRQSRGHRHSHSVGGIPPSSSRARSGSETWPAPAPGEESPGQRGGSHRRSISIVSLGSPTPDSQGHGASGTFKTPPRPHRGHGRASSLHITSRASVPSGPRSASHPHRPPFNAQPSPLYNASFPPSGSSMTPNTPGLGITTAGGSPQTTADSLTSFKFPMKNTPEVQASGSPIISVDEPPPGATESPHDGTTASANLPPRRTDNSIPTINENNVAPAARVLSTTSISGTPRSSTEFYSVSNNSTETLASEYVIPQPGRTAGGRPLHLRQRSYLSGQKARAAPEALMMGYAQIQGSFTLDGSLVDLAPFELVKRKAVLGGQGGGVIGVETQHKRESGLLRGFGWGSLTSSIGELLGGGELSTIKEMRGIADSKAVPLLSTPQSLLFVDLKLAPGESKSFEYIYRLPKGLPPTHKGRAMKISYGLVIGTQRPGSAKDHQMKSVQVPFRVLGSVNNHGEILGHDLMNPYVLLKDLAQVQNLDDSRNRSTENNISGKGTAPASTMQSFLTYVDELLNRPSQGTGTDALLSPTAVPGSRRLSSASYFEDGVLTAKEAIDMAILRSNQTGAGQQSANRFEIARNGRKVGVVTLARPSYRIGEPVAMTVDFSSRELPCYALHAALETAERVDPSLALRSEASVHRVTRRVYATSSEAAMFARRVVFAPTIPVSATPEFVTSGVSLEWRIRLEFVVPSATATNSQTPQTPPFSHQGQNGSRLDEEDDDDGEGSDTGSRTTEREAVPGGPASARLLQQQQQQQPKQMHTLLEEVSRDERGGLVLVAAETLPCESFEVAVPLRVYGATILVWLIEQGYTVVCFLANVGQEENWDEVKAKAKKLGAEEMVILDLQKEFVEQIVFRAIQCNAIYEDRYLLGTSLARPIIARAQVRVAEQYNCQYVSHGCTGKGNDQVRFELAFKACNPTIQVIAPWRLPEFISKFQGRQDLLKYAEEKNIPVSSSPKAPWSMDDNLVHCSYEAGVLEDPDHTPPKELWTRTVDPVDAPATPQEFTVEFEKGIPTKVIVDGKETTGSVEVFKLLNKLGHDHGVGRIDIVENRFIGLKSRGCYDTPGLTIARLAHLDLEGLVMDSKVREIRDQFCTLSWSRQLYNGMYFSPEREFVENSIIFSQQNVTGQVRLAVYKGNTYVLGRKSDASNLYSEQDASMDSLEGFSPMDTTGFIEINAIRLKKYGLQKIKDGKPLTQS
ncbi:hypothetical protein PpBr36_01804 [Pyricularia pennisetigena]|uniref:hypothetical protein n=1 Tax=Pyricularia pennisetigena TaxID=1578925 RepID=UPI00115474EC|nr:hypothetical protein PpBr36_01804 [Pyricularia pennisetigena]TLS28972.1 hypothetical protein PpBr36_01804 [Pyricularia pennisetigena]